MQKTSLKAARLSIQQDRLWPFQQGSGVYHTWCTAILQGTLNGPAFEQALQEIIANYEILHTVFYIPPGMDRPVQVITQTAQIPCPLIDLRDVDPLCQDTLLEVQLSRQLEKPFDLARGPLLKVALWRLDEEKHLFFCCLPALCADAGALPVLLDELGQHYSVLLTGKQEGENEEPLQYIDISAWQYQLLASESAKTAQDFWQKVDLSTPTPAQFPFDVSPTPELHTQPATQFPFEPAVEPVQVDEITGSQLLECARAWNVSPSTLLLACWEVVLWRLTGATNLVMSIGEYGREYEELTQAIGLMARFLPINMHLESHQTLLQCAASLEYTVKDALRWQSYFTWPSGTDESRLSYVPLAFEYVSWPERIVHGGLAIFPRQSWSYTEPFDLKLSVMEVATRLQAGIHYNQSCLNSGIIKRLASALSVLLQGAVEQPQIQIRNLPILSAEQREHLLNAYRTPPLPEPPIPTFHYLFEARARQFPRHLAVISSQERWTYQEVNARANQLARVLRRRGIGPGVPVGLCLTRSVQAIVGLLGIFKAGGAYVPLDPESPQSRLDYQLHDTRARLVLTQQGLMPGLPTWSGQAIYWEAIGEEMDGEEKADLPAPVSTASDLAYIIYTSGSTGQPKGVMVQHRNVVHYTLALCKLLGVVPGWHFATVSTLAADLGNTAIFCALASGGCLQVLDYETITSGEVFTRWATRNPIDVLKIVPSHLLALLAGGGGFLPRQALVMGGEALPPALLELLVSMQCACRLYNHYGPTEATIGVLINPLADLERYTKGEDATVPLGRPVPGAEVYILDTTNQEQIVPVGVVGELYVGGTGLAAGYLGRAEQTAEHFVPHPFSVDKGARLYRTGDLARYTPAGQIEFVGRRDNQVKLRGYRIELGEIEAALRRHPNVWECVVVLRKDEATNPALVGFLVPRKQPAPGVEEVQALLSAHLPAYMVPSTIISLKELPLTVNGKIDRQRLPRPEHSQEESQASPVTPRGPIEEILLDIWRTLLVVPALDVHDDFFQLGGHSLLATQVISQVRAIFHVEVSLASLFEEPTVAGLAQRIERALQGGEEIELPSLVPAERTADLPLSFAQQRLWFLDQLEPESPAYLVRNARRLDGRLDVSSLERALEGLTQRHESLRTIFALRDGSAVQVIQPPTRPHLPIIDLRGLEGDALVAVIHQLADQEGHRPCNLARGPLLRTTLLRLEAEDHLFLWTLHHIISDAWSGEIFVRELTALYRAFSQGQPSPLSPLPVQYADFAIWQRQWMHGEILDRQLAYWKQQLAGCLPLELPADHARPPQKTYRGAYLSRLLSVALQEQLVALSQQEKVTLFMLLLAAFQTLLARYTSQDDISVGTPIANRARAELDGLIGFFVNTLVLRTDLSGNPSFLELLKRVHDIALGAYAHQDVPFEYLVDLLQPERDLSRSPLFQVMFVVQQDTGPANRDVGQHQPEKFSPALLNPEHRTTKFDLTFSITSGRQGLHCGIEYTTDLFEYETIHRMLEHWQILLESIVARPQAAVSALHLLSGAELHCLLVAWNPPVYEEAGVFCLFTLFEQQAARRPDAVAVIYEEEVLTYGQLNARANQLARVLLRAGVGNEIMVGIALERSPLLIIGILGILKAGGAYVPLDPSYPAGRLAFMLTDSQMPVLLTQQALVERIPAHGVRVICLDTDWPLIAEEPMQNVLNAADSEQVAYVIYTSGSTGTPKGVMVTHTNVYHLFVAAQSRYHFNDHDVWTLFHSYAFDFSVWEIWGTLLYGGRLVVVPYEVSRTPEMFYDLLCTQQITVLNQTPSAFRQLLHVSALTEQQKNLALRYVIFGGEALDLQSLQPWYDQYGEHGPRLINMYGITETTVHVTYRSISVQDLRNMASSVIGGPLSSLQVYVLDDYLQPVPVGVAGQLFVGGAGLSRGYLKRPELTAERFIPHPFSSQPGRRLYKTGDLARFLRNGDLEYLGRVDQQVKIRGFRIELGEIEEALGQHPEIRECLVTVREDAGGGKRLVAYVIARQKKVSASSELRRFLAEKIPAYMVPALFVTLEAFPLTANGKLDWRALPFPTGARPDGTEAFIPPRTANEEILAGIWGSVLGIEQVGIQDNFFALGGDSIRSIQILSRARERGINFSLQQLFRHQSIQELLHALTETEQVLSFQEQLLPFSLLTAQDRQRLPEGVEDAYPLTALQEGMFFHTQYNPGSAVYHDITSYHLQVPFDYRKLERAMQNLVACHAIMRTAFDLNSFSEPLQLVYRTVNIPMPVIDVRHLSTIEQEKTLAAWIEEDKRYRFDWTRAPLLRFQIYLRSSQSFQFTLSFHHAVLDGWSVASLFTELFTTYRSLLKDGAHPLPAPPLIQYRHFVALEQRLIALEEAQHYWLEILRESTSVLLPRWTASAQIAAEDSQVYLLPVPISQETSDQLKKLARTLAVPIKSVLLAVHLRVLSCLYGQADVLTGLVSNGRPETLDGERVLGLFLNTLPFRMNLSGGKWVDLIREVFAAECELLPYRWYPLAHIQRQLGRYNLFEVMFNFIHFHVYGDLLEPARDSDDFQVLERTGFEKTNFTLAANFSLDLLSSRVRLSLRCNASELSLEQIKAIGSYYANTLASLARVPEGYYQLQSPLSIEERQRLLATWNATSVEQREEKCIHELFAAQAERTPEAVALVFENAQLTYAAMSRQVQRLACHLSVLGVGPEVLVGIYMERSLEMPVALLGVLSSGGAYVPLDPAYPPERLMFMLEDSQVAVLVVQPWLLDGLPPHHAQIVSLSPHVWEQWGGDQPTGSPVNTVEWENLAYVIYTSGSTGKPKGTTITHRAVSNFFASIRCVPGMVAQDIMLAVTSLSFDIAVLELLLPLTVGARVQIANREVAADGTELSRSLALSGATIMQATPTTWRMLLNEGWLGSKQVKMLCGGEVLPMELASQLRPRGMSLWNMYGPTETTIWSAIGEISGDEEQISIGRAIDNTQIYLLDEHAMLVPTGVPGGLYIGGDGLARGYLHHPELTAEKFLPNPFSEQAGTRIYATGDLARWLSEGVIECLGRSDRQVKVRGFRIELGEIETILGQYPALQESVVIAREDSSGEKVLVAYLVVRSEAGFALSKLRSYLQRELPEYMIPSHFVVMDNLPLTPNGKVDRRALPAPQTQAMDAQRAVVAPRNPIEEALAEIWMGVLQCSPVSIYDNFFELGGHSLVATRLISRIRAVLGVELPLRGLFERPSIAGLASQIAQMMHDRQAIEVPPLVSASHQATLPLSFAQQRLWILDRLDPQSRAYLMQSVRRIRGVLDARALEWGLEALIRRHASLRTVFQMQAEHPVQIIVPASGFTMPVIDLNGLALEQRVSLAQQLAGQARAYPCNLEKEPPLYIWLFQLSATDHALLIIIHHIIADAWSMQVFYRELLALYHAFASGQTPQLPALPVQYTDFAIWQRQWLQGHVLDEYMDYWRQQLAGAPALELPTDYPRPPIQTFNGALQRMSLPANVCDRLVALSHQEGVTLFMVLLAAFQVLLARYTGQNDISVGVPIANRTYAELENLIGVFVNTLVLRTDLSGNPSFVALLRRVREVALGAYAHQHVPFESLVETLQPERSLSRSPLFQILFNAQLGMEALTISEAVSDAETFVVGDLDVEHTTSQFDLTLNIVNSGKSLHSSIEYNTDLFAPETICLMLQHWQTLLESVARAPQMPLSSLALLTDAERQQLVYAWNDTRTVVPADLCLHRLIELQVQCTPEAIAGVFAEEHLTYAALNRRANQLAHALQAQGVGAEILVGIWLSRSLNALIALLGVLKAGGAYLPLDPALPLERLAFLLQDARVALVLSQAHLPEKMPDVRVILLEDVGWEAMPGTNPVGASSIDNLAYAIYTSGSTGRPKGVLVPHRAIVNHCLATAAFYDILPQDRVLQFASLSFDVAAEEIFPALARGATLVSCEPERLTSLASFRQLLKEAALTVLNLPAPYWHVWVAELCATQTTCPEAVRLMVVGSEQVLPERFTLWKQCLEGPVRWCNAYGSTEATITTTIYEPGDESPVASMPVGRPIANTTVYVLDRGGQPTPIGIAGEICIGGVGLARGYLNYPELTAEQFLPDPFSDVPGARMYCTGDRARRLPDGNLDFNGRIDEQIKIHGYRIEPGEVEAALNVHPAVRESMVLPCDDAQGNRYLVAYVVVDQPRQAPSQKELRQYLQEKLPEYMLPAFLIALDAFPLTVQGKVDRQALRQHERWQNVPEEEDALLHTPIEELLEDIWCDVLGRSQISMHENFFELGGHSLLAMQLISRLQAALQIEISLRLLFEFPTIAQLAAQIEKLSEWKGKSMVPPLLAEARSFDPPLSFAQQRLWFLDRLLPGNTAYLMPTVQPVHGPLNVAALEESLQAMIQRHESLRTTFQMRAGMPFQVIHPAMTAHLPVIDLREIEQEDMSREARQLERQEATRPCNLERGSLLRTRLLRLEEQRHVFLLTVHHIIFDGWSYEIMMSELVALYRALIAHQPSPLSPLAVQYADFAIWQRQWLQGEALESLLDYWTGQLSSAPLLALPRDFTPASGQDQSGALYAFRLSVELSQELLALSRREGATLFMTLLAAFQILLYRYSGQVDIVLGTDSANRRHIELEKLIGFFVNVLVLRTDLSGKPGFREVLRRTREVVLGAYAHQDAPFEFLVEKLAPAHTPGQTPFAQALFVMQASPALGQGLRGMVQTASSQEQAGPGNSEAPGGKEEHREPLVQRFPIENATAAKFDLAVFMQERAGQVEGRIHYRRDMFKTDTIVTMIERFGRLLQSIVQQPEVSIDLLAFFTNTEQQRQRQEEQSLRQAMHMQTETWFDLP